VHIMILSWGSLPEAVRLILLAQFGLVFACAIALTRSARHLFSFSGRHITIEDVRRAKVDAVAIAAAALLNRIPRQPGRPACPVVGTSGVPQSEVILVDLLREAGIRFEFVWEGCRSDVSSTRHASLVTFLLSLMMAAYGAFPIYYRYFNDSNRTGSWSMFRTAETLLPLVGIGWTCSTVLYFASCVFARVLGGRKRCWLSFLALVK
jgi:hypothetical protein